jgi:hypothetical protein
MALQRWRPSRFLYRRGIRPSSNRCIRSHTRLVLVGPGLQVWADYSIPTCSSGCGAARQAAAAADRPEGGPPLRFCLSAYLDSPISCLWHTKSRYNHTKFDFSLFLHNIFRLAGGCLSLRFACGKIERESQRKKKKEIKSRIMFVNAFGNINDCASLLPSHLGLIIFSLWRGSIPGAIITDNS